VIGESFKGANRCFQWLTRQRHATPQVTTGWEFGQAVVNEWRVDQVPLEVQVVEIINQMDKP
jgi:hypothetical protein